MFRTVSAFSAGAAALIAVATPALANKAADAVKARQGYYQMLKFNLGGLAAMAKRETPYDAAAAQGYADNLVALSKLGISPLWPEGTDNAAMAGKTRALPKIWSDLPGVQAKQKDFIAAAEALAAAAGGGLQGLGPAVGKTGGACKACHDDYRAKSF